MKIPFSEVPRKLELVGLDRGSQTAAFAVEVSDDGNSRVVDVIRVRLPLWPRSRQSRQAVESWAAWRLAEALEGGRS